MKKKNLVNLIFLLGIFMVTASLASAQESETEKKAECNKVVKYTCSMHPEVVQNEPGKCPQCGMDLVKMEPKQMYTCSMHPEVMSDKPGKCPQCGMDLIKVEHHGMQHKNDSTTNVQHQHEHHWGKTE